MVPSCQEAGILGAVAGVLGVIQATEVLKYILGSPRTFAQNDTVNDKNNLISSTSSRTKMHGIGELLVGKLLVFNALEMSFRKLNIQRNKNCPVCGDKPTITELIDYEQFCQIR